MLNKLKLIIAGASLILMILVYYFSFKENLEGFTNTTTYIIPKNIFQTWKTLNVPPKMNQCIKKLQTDNPEFAYYLYDDAMCADFIKDNFDDSVICAYNKLIPTAYKADLFRYCILYIKGGIYLDIKYECANNFKLTELTNAEYFVRDIEISGGGIYNGVMVCKPKNNILYKAIYKIVENVNAEYYGLNSLSPTGPLLLKTYFSQYEVDKFKLTLQVGKNNQLKIYNGNELAMVSYSDYRMEQLKTETIPHYGILWNQRRIYKKGGFC
jgi:mannosyltransferase OCH1-like enzyme